MIIRIFRRRLGINITVFKGIIVSIVRSNILVGLDVIKIQPRTSQRRTDFNFRSSDDHRTIIPRTHLDTKFFFATISRLFSITYLMSLKIKGLNYWRESHASRMKFLESFIHERVAQEPGCKRPVVRRRANSSLYESMLYSASALSWVGTRYSIVEPSVSSDPV